MQVSVKQHTLAEYRSLEETAVERHEYHDGEIVAMTGGTFAHSAIAGNIYAKAGQILTKVDAMKS